MSNNYVAKLLQIRPQYTADPDAPNQPENVMWLLSNSSGTPNTGDLNSICTSFDNAWGPLFNRYGGSNTYFLGSIITDWSSDTGLQYNNVGSFSPEEGGGATNPTAPQVAILISLHIPRRYRGGHGRIYLPHVAGGLLQAPYYDQISTSVTSALATDFNGVSSAVASSGVLGGQQIVVFQGKTTPKSPVVTPIASFTVNAIVATQRRRVRKVSRK